MRKIAVRVADKYCGSCPLLVWSLDETRWTCPPRNLTWTEALPDYAKPIKACREAEVKA